MLQLEMPPAELQAVTNRTFRQRSERTEFDGNVMLTGLDESLEPCTAPFAVKGRNISKTGISIQHQIPLPFRFVAIDFDESQLENPLTCPDKDDRPLVAKFAWCRYVSEGEYISGGRFLNLNVKQSG